MSFEIRSLSQTQLRNILKTNGLSASGDTKRLIKRLETHKRTKFLSKAQIEKDSTPNPNNNQTQRTKQQTFNQNRQTGKIKKLSQKLRFTQNFVLYWI